MNTKLLLSVLILGLTGFTLGCGHAETKEKTPVAVKVRPVETHSTVNNVRYSANIRPSAQVDVAFKVSGYVDAITRVGGSGQSRYLQAGDIVRKGTVLARVRQSDFQARVKEAKSQQGEARAAVAANHAQLKEATASVETARAQVLEAQANYDRTSLDFDRSQKLFATQSVTKPDHDAAKAQFDMAKAKLDAARSQLKAAEARVANAQAQIGVAQSRVKIAEASSESATIPLRDTQLISPLSGVVIERKIEVGTLVAQGTAGFVLADLSFVKAAFGVPDLALQSLKLGDTIMVSTDALPGNEFSGHISRIAPAADQSSRVFDVEVTIPNPQALLKPGMIAALAVSEGVPAQVEVPVVPLTAVARAKDNPSAYAVFVVEEVSGKRLARQRVVNLGESFGNAVAVVSGLKAGELVITLGATQVADGDLVTIVP